MEILHKAKTKTELEFFYDGTKFSLPQAINYGFKCKGKADITSLIIAQVKLGSGKVCMRYFATLGPMMNIYAKNDMQKHIEKAKKSDAEMMKRFENEFPNIIIDTTTE